MAQIQFNFEAEIKSTKTWSDIWETDLKKKYSNLLFLSLSKFINWCYCGFQVHYVHSFLCFDCYEPELVDYWVCLTNFLNHKKIKFSWISKLLFFFCLLKQFCGKCVSYKPILICGCSAFLMISAVAWFAKAISMVTHLQTSTLCPKQK